MKKNDKIQGKKTLIFTWDNPRPLVGFRPGKSNPATETRRTVIGNFCNKFAVIFFDLIILGICLLESGFWAKTINQNFTVSRLFGWNEKVNHAVPFLPALDAPVQTTNVLSAFIFGVVLFFVSKFVISMAAAKLGILDKFIQNSAYHKK